MRRDIFLYCTRRVGIGFQVYSLMHLSHVSNRNYRSLRRTKFPAAPFFSSPLAAEQHLEIGCCTFLKKRYHKLLFFSDGYARRRHRQTFRSTDNYLCHF
jgi:hypothetical protein